MTHLTDQQLSATYKVADAVAGSGQKRTKRYIRIELLSLLTASITGLVTLRVSAANLDILAAIGGIAFATALAAITARAALKPETEWYTGRAAAESARTLAWRYSVGGDPFPLSLSPSEADQKYLSRLEMVLNELKEAKISSRSSKDREISNEMTELRNSSPVQRRLAYETDRIADQVAWYSKRSTDHARSATWWRRGTFCAALVGFMAAILKFSNVIDFDALGVAAAVTGATIAWSQLNQFQNLAVSYALASRELSIIRDRVASVDPGLWASFVSDSEDAISREHTMWLARYGHPRIAPGATSR